MGCPVEVMPEGYPLEISIFSNCVCFLRNLNHSRERCLSLHLSNGQPGMVTLGNAAKQLGISKPTISKAIAKGHLSAARRDDGSFAIDPSELVRWWDGVKHRFQPQAVIELQPATRSDDGETADGNGVANRQHEHTGNGDNEVARRLAALEAEVRGLRELVAEVKASRDDAKATADHWRVQAERLTMVLPAPLPTPAAPETSGEAEARHPSRPWWKRLAG